MADYCVVFKVLLDKSHWHTVQLVNELLMIRDGNILVCSLRTEFTSLSKYTGNVDTMLLRVVTDRFA